MSSVYDLSLVLLSKESPSPLAGSFPYLPSALQQVKCICLRAFASAAPSGPRLFLLLEGSVPILYLQRGLLPPFKTF